MDKKRRPLLAKLMLLVILVTLGEIYVLVESGRQIGIGITVLLVILTGLAGSWLMRQQGMILLRRIQGELGEGRLPTGSLLDGALVLVGGVMLLTPGFCTDLIGFTLLVPTTRRLWGRLASTWLARQLSSGKLRIHRL